MFFKPLPKVERIGDHKAHVFECTVSSCHCRNRFICWFLDTGDAKSTGNLRQHAKVCWGEEVMLAADDTQDIKTAWEVLQCAKGIDGSITAMFQCAAKGRVTYSHRQHTKLEVR